uniref:BTB/POZ domain-containing protein 9 n=1 Tax=Cacopsylla melanoneura TaxID=428564 RepID=A0A8D9EEK3_9HEMI
MAEVKQDVMYKKKYLETIANLILNNEQLSDVTFVVNKKHYHASRIHVSAASQVFASLLNEHFANTTDKELVLTNIKHNASLFNILQYIHGIELNLTSMSKLVLCELTHLAERFKLAELHDDLKAHVSNIKRFKMNSVVPMLNTARTYNLTKLYDKLKEYVYQRAEQIVNHQSFLNLKYDVVIDLLKSNWLYAKEIDILRAALNWHDENIMDVGKVNQPNNENTQVEMEFQNEDINDEDDVDCEDDSWGEIDIVEDFLSKYSDDLFDSDTNEDQNSAKVITSEGEKSDACETFSSQDMNNAERNNEKTDDSNDSVEKSEIHGTNASEETINQVNKTDDPSQRMDVSNETSTLPISETELLKMKVKTEVERFSENILNKLLEQIRFPLIPMFEFMSIADKNPFMKYKENIRKKQLDMFNCEPRDCWKHTTNPCSWFLFTINNITKLRDPSKKEQLYSQEKYSVNHLKWDVHVKYYKDLNTSVEYMDLFLHCDSERIDWKVDVDRRFTLLSNDPCSDKEGIVDSSPSIKFDSHDDFDSWGCSFVELSTLFDPNNGYVNDDSIRVELCLKINSTN